MTFQRERISDVWAEALPMLTANHAETGILTSEDFKPSKSRFEALESVNVLKLFTAREAGKLVGYALFLVVPHLHFSGKLWAQQDAMFILPEYRGFSGAKFIQYTDTELRSEGVDLVLRHVTPKLDYSRTLERMGYGHIESAYLRRL